MGLRSFLVHDEPLNAGRLKMTDGRLCEELEIKSLMASPLTNSQTHLSNGNAQKANHTSTAIDYGESFKFGLNSPTQIAFGFPRGTRESITGYTRPTFIVEVFPHLSDNGFNCTIFLICPRGSHTWAYLF
jgi:hypothetical protein